MGNFDSNLEQAQIIRLTTPPKKFLSQEIAKGIKERLAKTATDFSLSGDVASFVAILDEALLRVIELLYARDDDGAFANVDNMTGRILRPMPWGASGYKLWNMRQLDCSILRAWLMRRHYKSQAPRPPLFIYNELTRRWYLNVNNYTNKELAMRFWEKEKMPLAEWREIAEQCRKSKRRVKN